MRPAPRGEPGGVLVPLGVGLPPLALLEKEGGRGKEERGAPPPLPCPIRTRGEGRHPLLPSLPSSPSLTPTPTTWKGGILLPVGVGLLLGRAIERPGPPPLPWLLYIRGQGGTPRHTS